MFVHVQTTQIQSQNLNFTTVQIKSEVKIEMTSTHMFHENYAKQDEHKCISLIIKFGDIEQSPVLCECGKYQKRAWVQSYKCIKCGSDILWGGVG